MVKVVEIVTTIEEDMPMIQVSLLPMENWYHPLFDHNGEKNLHKLEDSSPPPIVRLVPLHVRRTSTSRF